MSSLTTDVAQALTELITVGRIQRGDRIVIGCSTSEVAGHRIGTDSHSDVAQALFKGLQSVVAPLGIHIVYQCCEHLNRALILERAAYQGETMVNVVPQPHAGGAMATYAYQHMTDPIAVEHIAVDAGLDIGDTFIGMHIKHVAVPVRLAVKQLGEAHLTAVRHRLKTIGGSRAVYDETLL